MRIVVECSAPKYAKGNYEFKRFEEVFKWLVKIKGFPRGGIGRFLFTLAKDGRIDGVYTARYGFKMDADFHDYFLAQKVARDAGLLQPFDRVNPKLDKALVFARSFDKEANRKT